MVKNGSNGANLGFEEKLWKAADKMRNNMDAAEYKHVVLGLIFLKYISDAFEEKRNALIEEASHLKGHSYTADKGRKDDMIDDPDEYRAENVFFVPERARWGYLQKSAKQSNIGKLIDDAMDELEKDNSSLRGV
ncbi:MAG: type I restriction-modification system subunit M N-terminal domain-containing protein, partial [bacterium]|nr:type I restriction-modification system subunit M N-terminal domain-containing protein [bacterium]